MGPLPKSLPTFDEPLEMLEACHEKIEAQLSALENLVPHVAMHGADASARKAARAVVRYFDTSGAAHNRDEDEDLFPLVRAAAARDGRDEVGATLYELEREHESMDHLSNCEPSSRNSDSRLKIFLNTPCTARMGSPIAIRCSSPSKCRGRRTI